MHPQSVLYLQSYYDSWCKVSFLERGVVKQFFNEVDVGEDHAPTAVASEAEGIQGVTFRVLCL